MQSKKVIATIGKLGMKSYPFVMADKIDGTGALRIHLSELKTTVPPGPGKGITEDYEVVNIEAQEEACEA